MTPSIRIVVCGDDFVGKSLMIQSLISDEKLPPQPFLAPVVISKLDFPDSDVAPEDIPESILIIDTSSNLGTLHNELKRADVVCLVYSDHYSYERISLHWMPMLRSMGINLPVVVCANKLDLLLPAQLKSQNQDEFIPLINEFKEIEACVRCSGSDGYNIVEAFYMCQRAITHPISPIFDAKEGTLKQAAQRALHRVFSLCDKDQDGVLNFEEFCLLHQKCFGRTLPRDEFGNIMTSLASHIRLEGEGISSDGFIVLNKMYAERGRHETIWGILRAFHYTNSLSLSDKFLYPRLDVNVHQSVELSPTGYRFLVDLFLKCDRDNDGGLNQEELEHLFSPTPGIPPLWIELNFPALVVCNDQGHVTLQGWLAQWNLTTLLDYKTTLEYFAYLGYEAAEQPVKVTKQRKRRQRKGKWYRQPVNDRNIFNCYLVGAPKLGKSSLMSLFLRDTYSEMYSPTLKPRICVKDIELRGGKQCYLILEELGDLELAILENRERLDSCDVICYCYDSSDPELFQYLVDLRAKHAGRIDDIPAVFVALKADLDKQQQRLDIQPESYTRDLHLAMPLHISSAWTTSLQELFIQLVDAAKNPILATPGFEHEENTGEENLKHLLMAGTAMGVVALVSIWIWRGSRASSH